MPSALFEIYQKNFDITLKRLSGMLELYQNQSKEAQSITLKEIELNISELERSISQMELEVTLEKIPDNKKKLAKIIDNYKNIVKQYKREIQDLKYKEESLLNKKNLAQIPSINRKKITKLNFLDDEKNNDSLNFSEDEDIALFIDKNNKNNNNKKENFYNYKINDNDELNLKKDEEIKRINEYNSDKDNDINSKIKNSKEINLSNIKKRNEEEDKDFGDNKYKLNKGNRFKKIGRKIFNMIVYTFANIINIVRNLIYKGYINLKIYLKQRYGPNNIRKMGMIIIIICFIIVYSLILIILNAFKSKNI